MKIVAELLTAEEKKTITEKAALINNTSEDYQLIHAMYACECLIQENVKKLYEARSQELSTKIINCSENQLDELKEEKRSLEEVIKGKRLYITVEYVEMATGEARAVKVGNSFTLLLPLDLKSKIKDADGCRNYEIIREIRKMMAHELGHLILHTDALCFDPSTIGTLKLKNEDKQKYEQEAIFFADKLLELRRLRNEEIKKDGGADKLM